VNVAIEVRGPAEPPDGVLAEEPRHARIVISGAVVVEPGFWIEFA
jgi:hypothetical protein